MCTSLYIFFFCFILILPYLLSIFFFFNDTATTEIYTLSLHDALPIYGADRDALAQRLRYGLFDVASVFRDFREDPVAQGKQRSEEHTSELQSRLHLVCRLLLEKKKKDKRRLVETILHIHYSA